MSNNKHFTHPALGINVYKGNLDYFAELEKKAQDKINKEKRKEKIKFWIYATLYTATVGNLWFWAGLWHVTK